jgi:putative glycosyltransferase
VKLSVVATLYKSPEVIKELVDRISLSSQRVVGSNFEIILVDDCCPLGSGIVASSLKSEHPNLQVVRLARNYGQHQALMTGMRKSSGDLVFILDGDLEEMPEWLPDFWTALQEDNADVVFGRQSVARRGKWDSFAGRLAFRLLNGLTGLELTPNLVTARLMNRDYVDALLRHGEKELFIAGLWKITGFVQVSRLVEKRKSSRSTYTFRWKFLHLLSAVASFSAKPLRWVSVGGVFALLVGLLMSLWFIFSWATGPILPGWTSVLVSVWLLGGALLFGVGIIAFYLSVIFVEVKNRPYGLEMRDESRAS